jgi:hypothetical protein
MQLTPLAHEHQYFVDCALDQGEISAVGHNALLLWAEPGRAGAIIDDEPRRAAGIGWTRGRKAICLALEDYAHALLEAQPSALRRSAMACAVIHMRSHVADLAEFAASWNFEDATTGGAALPFRKIWLCDDDFWPTPRALRRLMSPRAIRRYVKRERQSIPHAREIADRLRRLPWPEQLGESRLMLDLLREGAAARRRAHEVALRAIESRVFARQHFEPPYRIVRQEQRRQRRMIVKSAAIATALLGASAVSAFARGEPVALRGETIVLQARAARTLGTIGHGALDLTLEHPDGAELGKLCCFFRETPALDQLAAFALHFAAGEERAVLETGNLYALRPEAIAHPLLAEKAIKRLAASARPNRHERQQAAKSRYYDATRHIYVDAVRREVWGRDAARVERLEGRDLL